MNKLIRQYIRKIVISEMRRKAPLLDPERLALAQTAEPLDITPTTKFIL